MKPLQYLADDDDDQVVYVSGPKMNAPLPISVADDATSDMVNNPKHYVSSPSGVECIDVVQHMNFNLGNAMKYIWRCDLKGKPLEDLEKAVFYLRKEIDRRIQAAVKK